VAEDLNVFVNNVPQEPGSGKSYTATGTTLTFDAAPAAGTNNVYVVYRGLAEPTTRLEHPSGQPLAATTGAFSGNVTIGGNLSVTGTGAGAAGITSASTSGTAINIDSSNRVTMPARPAFLARRNGTNITIDGAYFPFDSTSTDGGFDIGSNYDTTNYKFTCPVAGVYFFSFYAIFQVSGAAKPKLRKNGSDHSQSYASDGNDTWNTCHLNVHVNAAANDYFQIYVTDDLQTYGNSWAGFSGHLVG